MKYYYFVIASLIVLINVPNAFGEDTLKIDTILSHDFDNYYNFPKQTPLVLTGNHDMCPGNDCKMIFDKYVDAYIGTGITLNVEPNNMTLNVYFKLKGSGEDKWIIGLLFKCEPIDIEKNAKVGTTKYVCNRDSGWFIPEEREIQYNYDYSASFELPSRHFIFNGTNTGTIGE